ncbi:MAG: hypothetical protein ACK58U_21700, partial [Rubrivivax sp.]
MNDKTSNWTEISTTKTPPKGLSNYGFTSTTRGTLVLYGGITNTGNIKRMNQNLTLHSAFWYLNLNEALPDFTLVNLNNGYGGISRVVLLEEETICILNNNMRNQMLIVDLEKMLSYEIVEDNSFSKLASRKAFGLVALNNSRVIVIGGIENENTFRTIDPAIFVLELMSENTEKPMNLLGILVIIPVLVGIAITMKIKTKNITKQTLPTKKMNRKNSTSIIYS